jgi:hypothetical protein
MSKTVIVTVSGVLLAKPSLTTSWKMRDVPPWPTNGVVKVGVELFAFAKVTAGPEI